MEERYKNTYMKSSRFSLDIECLMFSSLIKKIEEELLLKEIDKDLLFVDPSGTMISKALYGISCYFIGKKLENLEEIVINFTSNFGELINRKIKEFYEQHLSYINSLSKYAYNYPYLSKFYLNIFKKC